MNNRTVKNRVLAWIMRSELDEAAQELQLFLDAASQKGSEHAQDLFNQLVILASRLSALKREQNEGTLDEDEADERYNQIRVGLRDLAQALGQLPEMGLSPQLPFEGGEDKKDADPKPLWQRPLVWGGIILLAGLLGAGIFMSRDTGQEKPELETQVNSTDLVPQAEQSEPSTQQTSPAKQAEKVTKPKPAPTRETPVKVPAVEESIPESTPAPTQVNPQTYTVKVTEVQLLQRGLPVKSHISIAQSTPDGVHITPLGQFDGGYIFPLSNYKVLSHSQLRLAIGIGSSTEEAGKNAQKNLSNTSSVVLKATGDKYLARINQGRNAFRIKYIATAAQ